MPIHRRVVQRVLCSCKKEWGTALKTEWILLSKNSKRGLYHATFWEREKGIQENVPVFAHFCKKQHRKDKSETNKIGYLQAVGGNQVERTVGWRKYECGISLNTHFCMVITSGSMIILSHTQNKQGWRKILNVIQI